LQKSFSFRYDANTSVQGRTGFAAFMNNNHTASLDLEGFVHNTGRSLSSFKKEFGQTSPMKLPVYCHFFNFILCLSFKE